MKICCISVLLVLCSQTAYGTVISLNICQVGMPGCVRPPGDKSAVVSAGDWYKIEGASGVIKPGDSSFSAIEIGLYGKDASLKLGASPFKQEFASGNSGNWFDGPEEQNGGTAYLHAVPGRQGLILKDSDQNGRFNMSGFGRQDFANLVAFKGKDGNALAKDSEYVFSLQSPAPLPKDFSFWVHPLKESKSFFMPLQVAKTQVEAKGGPGKIKIGDVSNDYIPFEFSDLAIDTWTTFKDDFPISGYGEHSAHLADFGWFTGYEAKLQNVGDKPVTLRLLMTTGGTGASGTPSPDPSRRSDNGACPGEVLGPICKEIENNTVWYSQTKEINPDETVSFLLDFERAVSENLSPCMDGTAYPGLCSGNISDNLYPHTAGGWDPQKGIPKAGDFGGGEIRINAFDRLQVTSIGWQIKGAGEAKLRLYSVPEPSTLLLVSLPLGGLLLVRQSRQYARRRTQCCPHDSCVYHPGLQLTQPASTEYVRRAT